MPTQVGDLISLRCLRDHLVWTGNRLEFDYRRQTDRRCSFDCTLAVAVVADGIGHTAEIAVAVAVDRTGDIDCSLAVGRSHSSDRYFVGTAAVQVGRNWRQAGTNLHRV